MVGLLDIAPLTVKVSVRGTDVSVTGVSARGLVSLISRFPELQDLMGGRAVSPERLMSFGGNVVAAIIAAGTGTPGDEAAEKIAGDLPVDEQADLLAAILRVTLPRGLGPFVEKLNELGGALGGGSGTKAQGTT